MSGTKERRIGSLEIRDFDKFAENNKNILFVLKEMLKFVFKRIRSKRKMLLVCGHRVSVTQGAGSDLVIVLQNL